LTPRRRKQLTVEQEAMTIRLLILVFTVLTLDRNLEVTQDINQGVFTPGSSTATNTDARRPYPGYGSILKREFIARSSYDSLQIVVQRRMSKGFTVSGSYVLSNSEDLGSSSGFRPQDAGSSRHLQFGPKLHF